MKLQRLIEVNSILPVCIYVFSYHLSFLKLYIHTYRISSRERYQILCIGGFRIKSIWQVVPFKQIHPRCVNSQFFNTNFFCKCCRECIPDLYFLQTQISVIEKFIGCIRPLIVISVNTAILCQTRIFCICTIGTPCVVIEILR